MKLKIIHKLLILFISVSLFIYTISILYINLSSRDNFIQDAKELANSYSREYANVVTSNLHLDIGITRALAASFLGYRAFPENIRQDLYNEMLVKTFEQNSEYLAVWTSWELNTYQTGYDKDYGRRRTVVNQSKDKKLTIEVKDLNLMGDDKNSQYYKIKQQKCEFITDPYYYSYPNALGDSIMEVSIGTPIIENDKFVGLVGVDVELTKYQRFMQRFKPYGIGYAFLIANDGTVVGHPLNNFIGKKISLVYPLFEQNHGITDKIKNATPYSFDYTDYKTDNNYYVAFAPVVVGTADTPWSLGIVIPFNKIQSQANRSIFISLAVAFISIILLMFAISLISGVFIRPLNKTNRVLQALAEGEIDDSLKMTVYSTDEIGLIRKSVNRLIETMKETAEFALQIGKGNFEVGFNLRGTNDVLGEALLNMHTSLKQAMEIDKQQKIDTNNRNWVTNGLAFFNQLLRDSDSSDIEKFGYTIISNLVKYTNSSFGALYVLNDDNSSDLHLEPIATIAPDTHLFEQKRIEIGESLVGYSAKERETIFLTNLPKDYLKIGSGLGEAIPASLFITPMIFNERLFGVLEIASFHQYREFEHEFVNRTAESIAASFSSIKVNRNTQKLIEQLNIKTKEFEAREKVMLEVMENLETELIQIKQLRIIES